jgi:hypothetical protein
MLIPSSAIRRVASEAHLRDCREMGVNFGFGTLQRFPLILIHSLIGYRGKRCRFSYWRMSLSANRIPLRRDMR